LKDSTALGTTKEGGRNTFKLNLRSECSSKPAVRLDAINITLIKNWEVST